MAKFASQMQHGFIKAWLKYAGDAPAPMPELKGIPGKKSLFDFAFPFDDDSGGIAVEMEGIYGSKGGFVSRHQTIVGYSNDCIKYNLAQRYGWQVYRYTQLHLKKEEDIKAVVEFLVERLNACGKAFWDKVESIDSQDAEERYNIWVEKWKYPPPKPKKAKKKE